MKPGEILLGKIWGMLNAKMLRERTIGAPVEELADGRYTVKDNFIITVKDGTIIRYEDLPPER